MAMDKYEFNLKVDQMRKQYDLHDYQTAMKIADNIDWRRVTNVNLLSLVSDIYEKNGELEEAKEILLLAMESASNAKHIVFKLTELALRTGNMEEAEAFSAEFEDLAHDDPRKYLLQYKILTAKGAAPEQKIIPLERYTATEIDEEWMYELAEQYYEAGNTAKCVALCDRIMLFFGTGEYVDKAAKLKSERAGAALSAYQQELITNRGMVEEQLRITEEKCRQAAEVPAPEPPAEENPEDAGSVTFPAPEETAPAEPPVSAERPAAPEAAPAAPAYTAPAAPAAPAYTAPAAAAPAYTAPAAPAAPAYTAPAAPAAPAYTAPAAPAAPAYTAPAAAPAAPAYTAPAPAAPAPALRTEFAEDYVPSFVPFEPLDEGAKPAIQDVMDAQIAEHMKSLEARRAAIILKAQEAEAARAAEDARAEEEARAAAEAAKAEEEARAAAEAARAEEAARAAAEAAKAEEEARAAAEAARAEEAARAAAEAARAEEAARAAAEAANAKKAARKAEAEKVEEAVAASEAARAEETALAMAEAARAEKAAAAAAAAAEAAEAATPAQPPIDDITRVLPSISAAKTEQAEEIGGTKVLPDIRVVRKEAAKAAAQAAAEVPAEPENRTPGSYSAFVEGKTPEEGLEAAKRIMIEMRKVTGTRNSAAKIHAGKLNEKGVDRLAAKLSSGDIIIEDAGDLSAESAAGLVKILKADGEKHTMLLVDNPLQLSRLAEQAPELAELLHAAPKAAPSNAGKAPKAVKTEAPAPARPAVSAAAPAGAQAAPQSAVRPVKPAGTPVRPAPAVAPAVKPAPAAPEKRLTPAEIAYTQEELGIDEFAHYASDYAKKIDCVITGKSMLALYERIEIMQEDGVLLTRQNAEALIEEAADKAEKPPLLKKIGGLFSRKYDKEGMLILKEEDFIS